MAQDLADLSSGTGPQPGEDGASQGASRTWKVLAGMDVVGTDGLRVGLVDAVGQDSVVLAADGASGRRRRVPQDWIGAVDSRVTLRLTSDDAMRSWMGAD